MGENNKKGNKTKMQEYVDPTEVPDNNDLSGVDINFDLDTDSNMPEAVYIPNENVNQDTNHTISKSLFDDNDELTDYIVPCLTNKKVTVQHIKRTRMGITNPKHVLYGGMADHAIRGYDVPVLESNNQFVKVLTNDEKTYLEQVMGMEQNALSIYLKDEINFWVNKRVNLSKEDKVLDLSNPNDYIDYKILLANKDAICPSLKDLQNFPKETYEFVMIEEGEEVENQSKELNNTMRAFKVLGTILDDYDKLKHIIETVDGKPISKNTKREILENKAGIIARDNPKMFLQLAEDKLINVIILINKAVDAGYLARRGTYFYIKETNQPLCENGQDPTLRVAAQYLSLPKNQTLRLSLEAKVN